MAKGFYIMWGFILCCFIGGCLYLAGGISATSKPIRYYTYSGSIDQLSAGLIRLALIDESLKFKASVRDSSVIDDGSYRDMSIVTKMDTTNVTYSLVCERIESSKTQIKLVAALIDHSPYGGYSRNAPAVKPLLYYFENTLLRNLKEKQKIVLKPDTSFWTNFSVY